MSGPNRCVMLSLTEETLVWFATWRKPPYPRAHTINHPGDSIDGCLAGRRSERCMPNSDRALPLNEGWWLMS